MNAPAPVPRKSVTALHAGIAKVTDLEISFEAVPVQSAAGMMVWAEVQIAYTLSDLEPIVSIRVPIPWNDGDTPAERKGRTLRYARHLIDHACRAGGVGAHERAEASMIEDAVDAIAPPAYAGLAQELGLAKPANEPRQQRRSKSGD